MFELSLNLHLIHISGMILELKQSHDRLGQALRVPGGWASQISSQSGHEGGKFSPTHCPPPRKYSWYSGWVNPRPIVQAEGLRQWKIPGTPLGIEPATFRLIVISSTNCHRMPPSDSCQTQFLPNNTRYLPVSIMSVLLGISHCKPNIHAIVCSISLSALFEMQQMCHIILLQSLSFLVLLLNI